MLWYAMVPNYVFDALRVAFHINVSPLMIIGFFLSFLDASSKFLCPPVALFGAPIVPLLLYSVCVYQATWSGANHSFSDGPLVCLAKPLELVPLMSCGPHRNC